MLYFQFQSWPKFALSTFMTTDKGIACTAIASSEVETVLNDGTVKISLSTDYPFNNILKFTVSVDKPLDFNFDIRIPGFCSSARVNGEEAISGEYYNLSKTWIGEEIIEVVLNYETVFINRPEDMVAVRRGPLLYSIAIEEEWNMIDYGKDEELRVYPHCDYEVLPHSQWNYGYVDKNIEYMFNGIGDIPFNPKESPIEASASVVEINWPKNNGIVARVPVDRKPISEVKTVKLLPYGCTNLRMTEIPFIEI
ncbi:beta-L-arabinofuranosidase domain-containing protein [Metabacillus litoralis]|uniref:Non-reducing end beta-L-arabinofuranosidase-like GH127 middle domain-containing protein n=2 Tax=Metabacillus TaxID=2675233 RepID=A0A179SMY8_9BACI|nr:beta-L-arabinofuranosidase domain-containing protein [Metabacillus litoralis]OAS82688.1 hypothetical protein A6K24_11195 [Metabacillus litoralis]